MKTAARILDVFSISSLIILEICLIFRPSFLNADENNLILENMNNCVAVDVDESRSARGGLFELAVDLKKLALAEYQLNNKNTPLSKLTLNNHKLTLSEKNLALSACADNQTIVLPFRYQVPNDASGLSRLLFRVPKNFSDLRLYFDSRCVNEKAKPMNGSENILTDILQSESIKYWKVERPGACEISPTKNGLVFNIPFAPKNRRFIVYREIQLPDDCAGRDAFLEADLQNLSKMAWGFGLGIRQIDALGKDLPSSVTDPRWTFLAFPDRKNIEFRVPGRFDVRAKKIRIYFEFHAIAQNYDLYGRPLKDPSDPMPKLLVKRLVLRGGNQLNLLSVNPALFGGSLKNVPNNSSFRLNGRNGFFFNVNSQAVWGEHRKVFQQQDYFWPFDDGTIEFLIKPEQWASSGVSTLCQGRSLVKGPLFSIDYFSNKKELGFSIYEPNNKSASIWNFAAMSEVTKRGRHLKKSFPADLKINSWHHISVCWKWNDKIEIFVDGRYC